MGSLSAAVAFSGLSVLASSPAQANQAGTGLVINEVYGGGGNGGAIYKSDFVELFNPTGSAINVDGWSIQYRSETGVTAVGSSNMTPLTGSVPAHGYYLVKAADGAGTQQALPQPDVVGTIAMGGTAGQVFLSNSTTLLNPGSGNMVGVAGVVDMVGWGSATGGTYSYEGTGKAPATANATSTSRGATHTDSDNNAVDFTTGAPTPKNSSEIEGGEPDPLAVTNVTNKTFNQDSQIAPINLVATGGVSPYTWSSTTLPDGLTLNGNKIEGTPTALGTTSVTVTATDAATPTAATAQTTFSINVQPALELKTIADIQGTGARSPYAPATGNDSGQRVRTQGVVTAMYRTGGLNGMFIQTGGTGTTPRPNADASDAIFVYGGSTMANIPAGIEVGDSVDVTGWVSEFYNATQISPGASGVAKLDTPLPAVTPLATAFPTTDAAREPLEGMLLAPTGQLTVSNVYATNQYGEVGLATGDLPLKQPSEYADATDAAALQAIKDENAQRAVVLDDGTSINFLQNQANKGLPVPYLTGANGQANPVPPRVGAGVTFNSAVILDWRNDAWKLQPRGPVTLNGADVVSFEDTRSQNLVPQDVLGATGDIKIATFNVLNYFNTTGEAYVAAGPAQNPPVATTCSYYTDRAGARIGNNTCGVRLVDDPSKNDARGPRGAATDQSLARQEAKLAKTIVDMNADVIGLEEIENSIKLPGETNRDDALSRLVELLNNREGAGTWKYVRSPGSALTAQAVAEQDTIRPAFIYKPAKVTPVGQSEILFGTDQFANAREPLAQAFKKPGAPDSDAFAVIVNHFKSKGDNTSPAPPATGDNANTVDTGAFNGDRKRQATRLVQFADEFAADRGIEAVFLAGDFNSYSGEEPIKILKDGGYAPIESDTPGEMSYSHSGLSGSLDHVLGNPAAKAMVTGADIWEINANEAISYQYSRYNYNVTDFWEPTLPFATSDHNPEIVGLDLPDSSGSAYKEIQVLGTNDFHGRLLPDGGNAAGAGPFATAVKELREENPNTIFAAAGDLVGASTFESFIQDDNPTIDALNAMGLEVSAAGNHEFDRGYADFVNRIQNRADWEYIAANVEEPEGQPDKLAETWTKTIDGVKVGFVGAVTEDLPALVNPAGIQGVTVTDVVEATNAAAADLKTAGADIVILLVHEGAPTTSCSAGTDAATTWGNIVQNTSAQVDAIISGHTHLAYNCKYTVPQWVVGGRAVTQRPVVSAGQYGTNLNKLVFKFDTTTGNLAVVTQDVIATAGVGYPSDPTVQGIVDAAVAHAQTAGAAKLGYMDGAFNRARYLPGGNSTENRGGESTLNNQVAEVQRWATDEAGIDTDIAFMNPGGLRADMAGTPDGGQRSLSYREAADVQPFANTLVNMKLTGAQLKKVLEQQWQRTAQGGVPSRPFLRLGVSKGFTYTYTEKPETVSVPNSAPVETFQGEITGMWLNGEPIDPAQTYSITVNSFLGGGGDNFWELANGTQKVDTGQVDLQAMVDYMKQFPVGSPLPVDYRQRAVRLTPAADAPDSYRSGDTVKFAVGSWAMSANGDATDTQLQVKLGNDVLGTFAVDNTLGNKPYDDHGTAAVSVQLPADVPDGKVELTVYGPTTKTSVPYVIQVDDVRKVQVLGTNDFHGRLLPTAANREAGAAVLSGAVKKLRTDNPNTIFAAAGDLVGASTFESFIQKDKPTIDALNEAGLDVSAVGNHELDQGYDDLVNRIMADYDATSNPLGGARWKYLAANLKVKATGDDAVPATWIKTVDGVDVGFVGAVTEDLPTLVSPSGIADLRVDDIVDSVNAEAADLRTQGADVVVMLVHEGSPVTDCASPQFTDPTTTWGNITQNVSSDVDAIVSGHTHLAYNCSFPVADWASEGRAVTQRPVVSSGQYGMNLNQLEFSVDETGKVVGLDTAILPLMSTDPDGSGPLLPTALYPADPAVQAIVDAAVSKADVLGAKELGELGGVFNRAKLSNATTENRGGESSLGNLVAEVQRWATEKPESGSAQIAFMNPGGLRQDMGGTIVDQAYLDAHPDSTAQIGDRVLSYKQAAVVQPFANTLMNMKLTGAQIKKVLEQQWQRDGAGKVPTRPFLRLGVSEGFTYTYAEKPVTVQGTATFEGTVTGMWLNGTPIDLGATYSVTVNSFLASGGDNFFELKEGTGRADTGKVDLQAMVDYLAAKAASTPLPLDSSQRAVGILFPDDAPASYQPGGHVVLDVSSWTMSTPADAKDTEIQVKLGNQQIGTATLDNTIGTAVYDQYGTAHVDVTLPANQPAGATSLTLVGASSGTEVIVPITVAEGAFVNDTKPVITGTPKLGVELSATAGSWTPTPTTTSYQWLAGGAEIAGATTDKYTPTAAEVGKVITVRVTVEADGYTDGVAVSDPTAAVAKATFANGTKPVITGTAQVGAELSATAGSWTPTPTTTSYQWLAEGAEIAGATTDKYTLTGAEVGKEITVRVTVEADGYTDGVAVSDPTAEVDKKSFTTQPTPTISGTVRVGKVLTANAGTWVPTPASLTYQWFANGAPIAGVTGSTLRLKGAQAGKRITVQVRATAPDYKDAIVSSAQTVPVAKGAVTMSVKTKPGKVKVKKTKTTVTVTLVNADREPVTGKVKVKAKGLPAKTVTVVNGKAVVKLGKFKSTGRKKVTVTYLGSTALTAQTTVTTIWVVRR
ncbi:ExeM/NucH family extracellular endonuclease [Pimelobacter sp. 30-1]|uniref:ExeM/NucH family extracellular endonuclease n=1 Tax=Pimelobacter sp. 30-1 TaxID=2004991 RepID=UPI001C05B513|nr:ExeM/NucH family extracellular endonuclease [Pimelobacter sp. 30-1]